MTAHPEPLSRKILRRPRLLAAHPRSDSRTNHRLHTTCFNSTPLERTLAVQLGIPMYANDPDRRWLGGKNGSRDVLAAAGIAMPKAVVGVRDVDDVVPALAELRAEDPSLRCGGGEAG